MCARLPLRKGQKPLSSHRYKHTQARTHCLYLALLSFTNPFDCVPNFSFSSHSNLPLTISSYFCAPQIDFDVRPREWVRIFLPTCKMRIDQIRFDLNRFEIKSNQTKYNNKFSCGGGGSDTNGIGYYKIITSNEKGEKRPKREQEHQQIWNNLTAITRSTIFTEIYIQHTYMHAPAVYTPNVYIISISSCVFHARHIYMLFCAHLNFFWLNSTHWFASTRTHTDTDTHRQCRSYDMLLPLLTEFLRQRRVLLISKVLCWHSSVGILCVRVRIGRW